MPDSNCIDSVNQILNSNRNNSQKAAEILPMIPANLDYNDWTKVAAALKHEGVDYSVFNTWSKTSQEKYSEEKAEHVWKDFGADDKEPVTLGTLVHLARKYNSIIPAPAKMLDKPASINEMALQMADFIESTYAVGEFYELVTATWEKDGRTIPSRPGNINSRDESEKTPESLDICTSIIKVHKDGGWCTMNPINEHIKGKATSDSDITNYRYALIESDDMPIADQWQAICALNMPVKSVVHSGGKSLHVLVKIDAGNDIALYRERVLKLHDYLNARGFKVDRANKNPSRITRIPGLYRGNNMQYIVAREFGSKDWNSFESIALTNKKDRRAETSPVNGAMGGRPVLPVTDFARQYIADKSVNKEPALRFWNGDWWRYANNTWRKTSDESVAMDITAFLQRNNVDAQARIGISVINDVSANIKGLTGLGDNIAMPCWLPDGEDALNTMNFANGIMDIGALIKDGYADLKAHTSKLFSTDKVDYNYDPEAKCPMWHEYLNTTFDTDGMREALQMMFGYILSGRIDKNIGFFLIGIAGSGKTVTARVLRKLIGESQTCCVLFDQLGERFQPYPLTTHKLNLVEELPVSSKIKNISNIENIFKMVTDGAVIPAEEKFHQIDDAKAIARCVFIANELPTFVDRTNGLWDRLVVLPYEHRFRNTEEENSGLGEDLEKELPGILNWAIEGARKLAHLKRFPLPVESRKFIDSHILRCNHEMAFIREFVTAEPQGKVGTGELYYDYRLYTLKSGYMPSSRNRFNDALKQEFPDIMETTSHHTNKEWIGLHYDKYIPEV